MRVPLDRLSITIPMFTKVIINKHIFIDIFFVRYSTLNRINLLKQGPPLSSLKDIWKKRNIKNLEKSHGSPRDEL